MVMVGMIDLHSHMPHTTCHTYNQLQQPRAHVLACPLQGHPGLGHISSAATAEGQGTGTCMHVHATS